MSMVDTDVYLREIAIQLKRIADLMEEEKYAKI